MGIKFTPTGAISVPDTITKKKKKPTGSLPEALKPAPDIFAPKTSTPDLNRGISKQVAEIMGTIPTTEKTAGFTQQDIDDLQAQGVDVFDPHVLKQISRIEQGAQENLSKQEQALAAFLERKQPLEEQKNLTPEEAMQVAKETPLTQALAESAFGVKIGEGDTVGKEVAGIIDFLRVAIKGGKPIEVQQAESSLNDAMVQVGREIDLVKSGARAARDAKTTFLLVQNSISRLEASQKGFGKLNVRYWSDEGKEVEAQILIAKQRLLDMQLELYQAIAAGAIA